MTKPQKKFDFSQYQEIEDPIHLTDHLKSKFHEIQTCSKDEIALQLTNPDFHLFIQNAYPLLKKDISFLNFICDLEVNDFYISKYEMKELISKCKKRREMFCDEQPKITKKSKRVSFSLKQNVIKYYIPEHSLMRHGDYDSKDKQEASVLKGIWLHPIQIQQYTPYKTESKEKQIQEKRESTTLPVSNTIQNDFTPSLSLIKNEELICAESVELSLLNLEMKNEIEEMEIEVIEGESDEFDGDLIELIKNQEILKKILQEN